MYSAIYCSSCRSESCVWVETASDQRRRMLASTLLTSIYGLLFGVIIESGQTLSPWRSPSQLDVLCNGFGALFGALGGLALVRAFRESLRIGLVQVLRDQPSLLLLCYLFLGVLVDSYYLPLRRDIGSLHPMEQLQTKRARSFQNVLTSLLAGALDRKSSGFC